MAYVGPVFELSVIGIFDAGIANRERVVLRPTEPINLAHFMLTAGIYDRAINLYTPATDFSLWLGDRAVAPPSWIYVYTGPGANHETTLTTGEKALILHWGRPTTIFAPATDASIISAAAVIRIGGLVVALPLPAQTMTPPTAPEPVDLSVLAKLFAPPTKKPFPGG